MIDLRNAVHRKMTPSLLVVLSVQLSVVLSGLKSQAMVPELKDLPLVPSLVA